MIRFETDNDFQQGAFILLNKPYEWTSFDLVNKIKFKIKHKLRVKKIKVGHAGTLDPLATGLMIVCVGKYTKKIDTYQSQVKEYIATLQLGASTPSFDLETEIDQEYPTEHITRELIDECLKGFIGSIEQRPPDYSAVKVNGKRAYEYARKGQEVEIKKKTLVIDEIEVLEFEGNVLKIRVVCSKGTYIRALARDIGQALNSGAHLTALQRTQIGDFKIDDAIEIEDFIKFLENL
ncbi:tRNA pseudouridine(55) synthase TruB [Marinifilum caeruleilacunae]|jgi:tRNA pseudouridine55 synthase|uniref:tRNA pseudouridine synthase B n=1 Tax=Marinifilum caeruleilacunae TaxID=2499076 RepID=A0ABX1X214_9BACT|nr:tRNA pseudouridine(55) synthase TruB [Marinifilum caeruleilacunae]NOU62176.1 tRNA pseudouridine(55) synthase TruB [Marinifilum caeruleilacunae]